MTALALGIQLQAQYSSMGVAPLKVPKYSASGTSSRMPILFRLQITGLQPNSMYQYVTRAMNATDLASNNLYQGAGNPLYIRSSGYKYDNSGTSPNFTTGANVDTFYTDPGGNYDGWFGVVNTGNTRFTVGRYIYPGLTLRGGTATTDTVKLYSMDSIRVLAFGSSNTGDSFCTGIWGQSVATARNIVALYDNTAGTGRPLSITYVENDNVTINSVPSFYSTNVNGKNNYWGTYIPNTNSNGIRRIENINPANNNIVHANTDANGIWGPGQKSTTNPTGGLTAIAFGLDDAALTPPMVEFWQRASTYGENAGQKEVYVVRKYSSDVDQSVQLYVVSGGTATKSLDFGVTEPKTIVFSASGAQKSDTTKFIIVDDNLREDAESFLFRLQNPTNCVIGTEIAHTVNIVDNDTAFLSIKQRTVTAKETGGKISVTVKMDKGVYTQSRVRLFVKSKSDSAFIPSEFKLGSSGTDSTFWIGKTNGPDSITISANIYDDITAEKNDTFIVCIRQISGAARVRDSLSTLAVIDNDGPAQIRFVNSSVTVNEKDQNFKIRVLVESKSDADADFSLRFSASASTATDGTDFSFGSAKLETITASSPDTIDFTVNLINDSEFENRERAVFILGALSNIKLLKPDSFTVNIVSDDLPLYSINKLRAQSGTNRIQDSLNVRCRITGTLHSANFSHNGLNFMIADNTGGMSVTASKTFGYTPKSGDSVMLVGKATQIEGNAYFEITDTMMLIAGNRPLKNSTLVTDLDESNENTLVQARRVILVNSAEWPSSALSAGQTRLVRFAWTNGQIDTLVIDAETTLDGTPAPAGYLNITGIVRQFDVSTPYTAAYRLMPRTPADITAASLPRISFAKVRDTVTELADSFRVELNVLPTDENFTFDVVPVGGTATNPQDFDFTKRSINVIKNNSFFFFRGNLNDDADADGQKTIILGIRNIVGPGSKGTDSLMTIVIQDNEASSVKSFAMGNLKMFPNPAAGHVVIESAKEPMLMAEITDLSGKTVWSSATSAGRYDVNLNVSQGIYMVRVTTASGAVYSDKLIVK